MVYKFIKMYYDWIYWTIDNFMVVQKKDSLDLVADLFDGTRNGTKRAEMKRKSIEKANDLFGLNLVWKSDSSKFNQDDQSDAILIAYSQVKVKHIGKPNSL